MDRVNQKMKKFRGVLDGLRQSVTAPPKNEIEIEETLKSDHFKIAKIVRHGFPHQPTAMAYDPVQHLLAIGTKTGSLRILGQPGVDCHMKHDGEVAVIQLIFQVNNGALISACSDDNLHLWNFRQKKPEIVHSLKFQRERITCCHLPFQSKWLFVGTERGNVHIVNVESFMLSGYIIHWNKAIELARKTHPGQVVHLSDCPNDANKLLIGYDTGMLVMWDLKLKVPDTRFNTPEALRSVSWHQDAKQLMCSHADGSLTVWNVKAPQKPHSILMPHAKANKEGKPEACRTIPKVEWKTTRSGDPYVIFSGGMPYDKSMRAPSLTVMHGKGTTVLEMEHNVIDFITLCSTPYDDDYQDPFGIVVLLQNDLVVVDLTTPGYPCFENPYPMDIHESPVTACKYLAACPPDLIPAFYQVGSKQKKTGFSEKVWPVKGGAWGTATCSYPEIMVTGHADGSVKFWDASAVTLQVLYKFKTSRLFERNKCRNPDPDDDPFSIQHIDFCADSRALIVAGVSHVIMFNFCKQEAAAECSVLEISIVYEIYDEADSPAEFEYPPTKPHLGSLSQQSGSVGSYSSATSDGGSPKETNTSVKVKGGSRKWSAGYHPSLCCILQWVDQEAAPPITSLNFNSRYNLLAFGNECGLAIVDVIQKVCLLNMGTPDLYGKADPYSRAPRSPRSKNMTQNHSSSQLSQTALNDDSPTAECLLSPSYRESSPVRRQVNLPQSLEKICEIAPQKKHVTYKNLPSPSQLSNSTCQSNGQEATETKEISEKSTKHRQEKFVFPDLGTQEGESSSDNPDMTDPYKNVRSKSVKVHDSKDAAPPLTTSEHLNVKVTTPTPEKADMTDQQEQLNLHCKLMATSSLDTAKSIMASRQHPVSSEITNRGISRTCKSEYLLSGEVDSESDPKNEFENDQTIEEDFEKKENVSSQKPLKPKRPPPPLSLGNAGCGGESSEDDHSSVEVPVLSAQCEGTATSSKKDNFVRRLSRKVKSLKTPSSGGCKDSPLEEMAPPSGGDMHHYHHHHKNSVKKHRQAARFEVMDLSPEDVTEKPPVRRYTYAVHLRTKCGDGSFSRSRSSSMSSLENITKEAIQCLAFVDSYTRKQDTCTCPSVWVGTSLGSVLVINLQLPADSDRETEPVVVTVTGTIYQLKGAILAMSFLDCNGALIPPVSENWGEGCGQSMRVEGGREKRPAYTRQQSMQSVKSQHMSPTSSTDIPPDRHFAVICSEKHARVVSLPSQICAYKHKVTDTSVVTVADVITIRESNCLICYVANGHLMSFSLPSLRPLMDIDYLPQTDIRVAKTFSFSNNGHALYFCSPSEVQKVTVSNDVKENLSEMLGELFIPCDTPQAPKKTFFQNLFSGTGSNIDREELFGEASGKASKGVAKYAPGPSAIENMQPRVGGATSEIARARQQAVERGEKLGELSETTERMREEAERYGKQAHDLKLKYKKMKWYQF